MLKKRKKVVLALVCSASMITSVFPVSAAESVKANHVHVYVEQNDKEKIGKSVSQGPDNHMASYRVTMKCQSCNEKYTKVVNRLESHSWSDANDLGHCGEEEHAFRLICGDCEGGKDVRILCEYNRTGWHNTPW